MGRTRVTMCIMGVTNLLTKSPDHASGSLTTVQTANMAIAEATTKVGRMDANPKP